MGSVLIVGCGYIGQLLAAQLGEQLVVGLVRSPSSSQRLIKAGIESVIYDLDSPPPQTRLPMVDTEIYYFAPPPGSGETDPRVARFCAAITELPRKLVYISTSAVYGDCCGRWIDESAPLQPGTDRGKRRLHAEQTLLEWSRSSGVPVVILRVPGIYGPGKLPVDRLKKGLPILRAEDSPYTNRIHASDLVDVCIHAMQHGHNGEAYNVSDGHPTTMCDYFLKLAAHLDLPEPPIIDRAEAEKQLTPGMLSFLQESKRLSNMKLLSQLNVQLRYPDLDSGLASIPKDN